MIHKKMLINGEFMEAQSKKTIEVYCPADNTVCGTVPSCGEEEINLAVEAADLAFRTWSGKTPFERGDILRKAARLVLEHADEIAGIMTLEQGKPLPEAKGEVIKGSDILKYYAEEGERIYGRIIANAESNDIVSHVVYQPVGVAACISPWNYPIELLAWKIGGALASGCTCVMKAPTETPLSPIAFVEAMLKAGVPAGVINVITGPGGQIGDILTKHPKVKKVAFTGSTAVGKHIARNCADTLKKLSLELGGSEPMIVCGDADIEAAAAGACRRSFRNMGQICIAINRIYVERSVYEGFLDRLSKAAKALQIGNGLVEKCDLGPMCTASGVETAKKHVSDALNKGGRLITGGKAPEGEKFAKGNFYEPTVIADCNHSMLLMTEETFGPVVGIMPYDTVEEAIELANDCKYGLAAIGYTESLTVANKLTRELQAGNVAINNVDAGVINAPYGGWKDSGYGHEHGPEGLYEYLYIKHLRIKTG